MRSVFLSAILIVGMIPAAVAGSPTATQKVTPPPPKHWLSDGLNRLVFWQPPATSRVEHPVHD